MKIRTISIIAAAIGIFMAVGCKKESEGITLGASIANDDNLTKVHLSTTDQPLWDNGDPVWVNGDDTRTISDITDGTNAKIKGVTTSSSYLAIYPADMAAGTASNASIVIRPDQTYESGKIKFPMVAYSNNKHLFFYNLCSLVKVSVSNNLSNNTSITLKKISVRSSVNLLCGTMALTVNNNGTVTAGTPTNGGKEVELDLGSGVSVANGNTSQDFYIAVAPFASEKNITITITTTDNKIFSRTRTISSLAINTIASANLNLASTDKLDPIGAATVGSLKVISAPGNLQFKTGSNNNYNDRGEFQFANNQYDYIGNGNGTVSGSDNQIYVPSGNTNHIYVHSYSTNNNWIDLFGWATSGSRQSSTAPDIANTGNYVRTGCYANPNTGNYGPQGSGNVANTAYDWGVNNIYYLGSGWRTLTGAEWYYLMKTRSASSLNGTDDARFACVTLHIGDNDIKGTLIFPDHLHWPIGVPYPTTINAANTAFSPTYTSSQWDLLEAEGVWFLPAAGYRNTATNSINSFNNIQTAGYYWSTLGGGYGNAQYMNVCTGERAFLDRHKGCSVRLVKDVQ